MTLPKPERTRILYQLINFERNQKLLEVVPHIPYLDMAIVFYFWKEPDNMSKGAYLITNENQMSWQYSVDELEDAAMHNTPRELPVSFRPMEELIQELAQEDYNLQGLGSSDIPMHVLTNQNALFGATTILYPQVLWAVSESLQDDLYVLPSSIHECIIVPKSVNCSKREFEEIVTEINQTQVPDSEVLSNRVFVYHRGEDTLSV